MIRVRAGQLIIGNMPIKDKSREGEHLRDTSYLRATPGHVLRSSNWRHFQHCNLYLKQQLDKEFSKFNTQLNIILTSSSSIFESWKLHNTYCKILMLTIFLGIPFSSVKYIHIIVQQIFRTFYLAELKLYTHGIYFIFFSQALAINSLLFISVTLITLDASCKWNHTVFVFLRLAYITQPKVLQVYPCCSKWWVSSFKIE